ncbi:MAG: OsmC family protein [Eubacteriales bacterium]|nr:OsmC family protein [Eubacteriales bacterium]
MSGFLEASVELIGDKMMFEGKAGDFPPVITDYIPPLGEGKGYMPLQLFLISFASCTGGSIAPFLRRMGKHVAGLTISAKGVRREQHPTGFESITLDIRLVSDDVTDEDLKKVLTMAEETYCPVWAMIKNNVKVSTTYEIIAEAL